MFDLRMEIVWFYPLAGIGDSRNSERAGRLALESALAPGRDFVFGGN
jgi:hypothetical protein